MPFIHLVIWVLFFASIVTIFFFLTRRMRQNKKLSIEAAKVYQEKKEKYSYLKEGVFEECSREDITPAVLFQCMRKEDQYDDYIEHFSHPEKVVYGIYLLSASLDGSHPSLHSFFLSPSYKDYIGEIPDYFKEIGAFELSDLVKAARRFAEIIENNEDDEEDDPEMGDYSRYNFSDFTNEYLTLVSTTNISDQLTDYVLAHKEDFYCDDYVEPHKESGEEDNEGISE